MDSTTIQHEWDRSGRVIKNKDSGPPINLCRPDQLKSCAACCGLYNVTDGTRSTLSAKLKRRSDLFAEVPRNPDAIAAYAVHIRGIEAGSSLDDEIHVCEFTGLVDRAERLVGCMLHPEVPGNRGVDLRGLCHYGSLACRSFYCPPWEELPPRYAQTVIALVDDWHLYGLLITDADFLIALFGLLEHRLGRMLDPQVARRPSSRELLLEMLHWKNNSPLHGSSSVRRSRYYYKRSVSSTCDDATRLMAALLDAVAFTFDVRLGDSADAARIVTEHVEEFVRAHASIPAQ